MLIVFGAYNQTETLGKVGDFCYICQRLRTWTVTRTYRVQHLMGYPLSRDLLETGKRCKKCGRESICRKKDFAQIMPLDEEIDLDDLVKETNPTLAAKQQQTVENQQLPSPHGIFSLEQRGAFHDRTAASGPQKDEKLEELVNAIGKYKGRGLVYTRMRAKLDNWDRLNPEERTKLEGRVERFLKTREIEDLLLETAPTFPHQAGHVLGVLSYLFLQILFGVALAQFWSEIESTRPKDLGIWVTMAFVFPAGGGVLIFYAYSVWKKRRWFANVLVIRAEKAGIDLEALTDLLNERESFRELETPQLAALHKNKSVLFKMLRQQGRIE